MKTLFLVLGVSMSLVGLKSQERVQLNVKVENITEKGKLMVAVFDSQKNWEKYEPIDAFGKEVEGNSGNVAFNLPKGNYGVVAFIDGNSNRFFDYGEELYGFSNSYIPHENPTMKHFQIKVDMDKEIVMKMRK